MNEKELGLEAVKDTEFTKFDKLIYWTEETDLSDDMVVSLVKESFSLFDPESDGYNDQFLSDYNLDKYAYSRSLGLSVVESANSIGMSASLLSNIYKGHRVSLKKLINFAKAEAFAMARMKRTHLEVVEKADGYTGSLAFLGKAYSKEYGDRRQLDINTGFQDKDSSNSWNVTVHHVENQIKRKYEDEVVEEE